ncbi:unnamed protein product [Meloidogyne enterolobii]|uniref:Uncharacterized protein n=1 Tax=Meloidogyne enterolobii TaxID=390850 RepID=A0ACB0Z6T2_MELEN
MLSNFDCIVQSPKGSGKSLAFILPMMHILLKKKEKIGQSKEVSCKIIGLIIVPSRELVNQIFQLCKPICSTLEFRLIRLFGSSVLRNQELKVDVDQFKGNCVVITTPVSFDSFVNQHNQLKEYLKFLQVLIIDEADKFKDQFTRNSICSVLSILPEQRRSALFSATEMADKFEAKVNELARFGLRNPLKLTIGSDNIIQMNKEGEEDDQQEEEKKEIKQEDGSIVTPKPIDNDKVPDDIKTKRLAKFKLLPEIQLDILKCLDFSQLLTVQQSSFYFKNFIEKYGKELAKKEFFSLEFGSVFEELKLEDNECKFVKIELEHRFVEIEPHLYDFELSEQIKEKWEQGIEESVPMFFTMGDNEDIDMVVCELQQNRAEDDVYLQLPKFPKNMEEMKIARFLFQLLFNCAFESFYISTIVINPKMIELLFEETNMPLQIYSQKTSLTPYDNFSNFAWNHLSSNKLTLNTCTCAKDDEMDFFFKLLTERGNKFSNIRYTDVASRIYNSIIKVCTFFYFILAN